MFIPFVPRVTVVNKNIIYSDTVLPLKEAGNSLNVSSITGVTENDLENCLKVIFKANPDVVFNTIQYSRQNKKLYFYTDKKINTQAYEDSKTQTFRPVRSRVEILEEVKRILTSEKSSDPELISLYDVAVLLKVFRTEYDNAKTKAERKLKDVASYKFGDGVGIFSHTFDYDKKNLKIRFRRYKSSEFGDIVFGKDNGDLYVVSATSPYTNELMSELGLEISELYDTLLGFEKYRSDSESNYNIRTVNTSFEASVSHYGAGVYEYDRLEQKFKLFSPSYDNEFHIECNSSMIQEAFKNNEDELFKRIYVPISECPTWCQDALRERRRQQIIEEDKKAKEEMLREERRQKIQEVKEKIFPFLKKKK